MALQGLTIVPLFLSLGLYAGGLIETGLLLIIGVGVGLAKGPVYAMDKAKEDYDIKYDIMNLVEPVYGAVYGLGLVGALIVLTG